MINVKLKDGSIREVEENSSVLDLAKLISKKLGKSAVVGEVNGTLVDLDYKLKDNDEVNIVTYEDKAGIEVMRHTTSHVMAQAVKRLYKDVKLAIGPTVENGFYYDFDIEIPFNNEDLVKIEEEMNKIIKEDISLERVIVSREEALKQLLVAPTEESLQQDLDNILDKLQLTPAQWQAIMESPKRDYTEYANNHKLYLLKQKYFDVYFPFSYFWITD